MKQRKLLVCNLILMALTLISCDANKGKVEELANQFITAVNNQDKATIYSLYPNAKNIENMTLPDNIQTGEINIEKNDSNYYVANINNDRQQRLVFKVDDNRISLVETFSVLQLDSAATELAIKTGVPMKKLSDIQLSNLFNEDGKFIALLKEKYANVINGNLNSETGTYSANRNYGGSVSVTQPIRNNGSVPVKAEEYNVEFYFYCPNGTAAGMKKIEPGVNLEPGEGYTYYLSPGSGYVNACYEDDFNWRVSFVYKNLSPIASLLKYVKFSGDEYDNYAEEIAKSKDNSNSNDLYEIVSERKLTEDDLKDLSKEELSILRNTIYAKHGYIFKKKELEEHFNSQDWYKGTSTDMNKVSSEFNDSEIYNVKFIKDHE